MRRKKLPLAIASLMAGMLGSSAVYALGLGEIKLFSHLNEPLQAEVELVETGDLNAEDVIAKLASKEVFDKAEIEREFFLTLIRYEVVILPNGRGVLKLNTEKPVREPYLDLIIDATWANGRVLKQYTILLDPPTYLAEGAGSTVSDKQEATPDDVNITADIAQTDSQETTTTTSSQPSVPMGTERYTTQRNDTLWRIASKHQAGGASVFQTMDAIYKLNSDAFIKSNRDLLKVDQTLRLPSAEEIAFLAQGGSVEELLDAQQNPQLSSEQTAPTADDTAAEDKLKIVGSSSQDGTASAGTAESIDKIDRDNQDLNLRLSELTSQIQKMQQYIKLQDEQLTTLQQQLGSSPSSAEKKEAIEKLKTELSKIETELDKETTATTPDTTTEPSSEVTTQSASTGTATAATNQPQPTTAPVITQAPAVQAETKKPTVTAAEESVEEKSSSMWVILGGLLLAALALAMVFGKKRKSQQTHEAVEKDTDWSVDALKNEPSLAATMDGAVAETDTRDETKSSVPAESSPQAQLDSLAEANRLVAHGDLMGGINVLKEAIEQQSTRLDLRTRLLELSVEVGDVATFEAQESYISRWGGAAAKKLAVTLREKISSMPSSPTPTPIPQEGLAPAVDVASTAAEPVTAQLEQKQVPASLDNLFDDLSGKTKSEETANVNVSDFEASANTTTTDTTPTNAPPQEFDLSTFESTSQDTSESFAHLFDDIPSEASGTKTEEVDFAAELGLLDEGVATPEAIPEVDIGLETEEPSLSVETKTADVADYTPSQEQAPTPAPITEAPVETPFAVGGEEDDEFAFLAGTDEAATKLDLAKAYIDMEDMEGAKDILQEVLQEGNEAQQQEAKDLLARL